MNLIEKLLLDDMICNFQHINFKKCIGLVKLAEYVIGTYILSNMTTLLLAFCPTFHHVTESGCLEKCTLKIY